MKDLHPETHTVLGKLVHDTQISKPLVMPIYHSSTYVLPDADSYGAVLAKVFMFSLSISASGLPNLK